MANTCLRTARTHDGRLHVHRHGLTLRRDGAWGVGQQSRHDRLHRGPRKRRLAGEHLVRDRAQRVHIAARIDKAFASRLFEAHVLRRAKREARLR